MAGLALQSSAAQSQLKGQWKPPVRSRSLVMDDRNRMAGNEISWRGWDIMGRMPQVGSD